MIESRESELWIQQFSEAEKPVAIELLRQFRFVNEGDFAVNLNALVESSFPKNEVVAIFVESQMRSKAGGQPIKMFDEKRISQGRGKPPRLRAIGAARAPVRSQRYDSQIVGSEGVVASLVSQVARKYKGRFLIHPSADTMRKRRVRHIAVVTDFIGSGNRVRRMLTSLWAVRSIRSWASYRLASFSVVAYSGADQGVEEVEAHPSRPIVRMVTNCPTVYNAFSDHLCDKVIDLCKHHCPRGSDALGYKETGALIAFAHSVPNNIPAILRVSAKSNTRPWAALFESGSTVDMRWKTVEAVDHDRLALETLNYAGIASRAAFTRASRRQRAVILLVAAISRGRRSIEQLTGATGLGIRDLEAATATAELQQLVTKRLRPTAEGFALLRKLNASLARRTRLPIKPTSGYYPTALRAPD